MVNSRHLKRSGMPKSWPMQKKIIKFVTKPNPGSYQRKYVVPVVILLRDVLNYVKTSKEAKYVVTKKEILVNGNEVSDIKTPVGLFESFTIKKLNETYKVLFNEVGRIKLIKSDDKTYLKVSNKIVLKNGKFQVNTFSGNNVLVDKKEFSNMSINDTLIYCNKHKKVHTSLKFEEKANIYIFDGKFKGLFGVIKNIIHYNGRAKDIIEFESNGKILSTAKEYGFAIKKEDVEGFK